MFQFVFKFLCKILMPKKAKCKRDYTDDYRDEKAINEIKSTVGDKGKILVLVSGVVLFF